MEWARLASVEVRRRPLRVGVVTVLVLVRSVALAQVEPPAQAATAAAASVTKSSSGCPPAALDARELGARGDGSTDDTAALQRLFAAAAGKTACLPAGTYVVGAPLVVQSGTTIEMAAGTTLAARSGGYAGTADSMIDSIDKSNVTIRGGTLRGRKGEYTAGEWRHGIRIWGGSNVVVANVTIVDTPGDGVAIGPSRGAPARNVTLSGLRIDGVARNGISVVSAENVLITACTITGTSSARGVAAHGPWAGVDLEPHDARSSLSRIRLENVRTERNGEHGILVALHALTRASPPVDVEVSGWESVADGLPNDGNQRGALRLVGAWEAGGPLGSVLVRDSVIRKPLQQGVKIHHWDARSSPSVTLRNVSVIDPNEGNRRGDEYESAYTIIGSPNDAKQGEPQGNVVFQGCSATDTRPVKRMAQAFYFYSAGGAFPVRGLLLENPSSVGQRRRGGPAIARTGAGGRATFEVRYATAPSVEVSADTTLNQDYFGLALRPTADVVLTLPPAADWGENELRLENDRGVQVRLLSQPGEAISYEGATGRALLVGERGAILRLGASAGGIVARTVAGRARLAPVPR